VCSLGPLLSSSGPLTRPMYFSTCGGVHLHGRLPSPRKPHGHGFMAAARMKLAGKTDEFIFYTHTIWTPPKHIAILRSNGNNPGDAHHGEHGSPKPNR